MYCTNCGGVLEGSDAYCLQCGTFGEPSRAAAHALDLRCQDGGPLWWLGAISGSGSDPCPFALTRGYRLFSSLAAGLSRSMDHRAEGSAEAGVFPSIWHSPPSVLTLGWG